MQLIQDYPDRVYLWLGPVEGDPADCILGMRVPSVSRAAAFRFRLDNLHQCNENVVRMQRVALRLIVQFAYSYDVVAVLDGLDPEQIGLR